MATRKFEGKLLCCRKQDSVGFFDIADDSRVQVFGDDFVGDSNGVHDRFSVAGAVGFEDISLQSEQGGSAVSIGIELRLYRIVGSFGAEVAEFAQGVLLEFAAEKVLEKAFEERFAGLEYYVACEPVANHDIDHVFEELETFDGAAVIDEVGQLFEQVVGGIGNLVAFAFFRSDGHQADARIGRAEDVLAIIAAEHGVVDEVFGFGEWVGSGVDQDEMAGLPRHDRGEGRTFDAGHGAQANGAACHEDSGIAAAYDDCGAAFFDQLDGSSHARIALLLHRLKRLVAHFDYLSGVMDRELRMSSEAGIRNQRRENRFLANEKDRSDVENVLQGDLDGCDYFGRSFVGAHRIDCDAGLALIEHNSIEILVSKRLRATETVFYYIEASITWRPRYIPLFGLTR